MIPCNARYYEFMSRLH